MKQKFCLVFQKAERTHIATLLQPMFYKLTCLCARIFVLDGSWITGCRWQNVASPHWANFYWNYVGWTSQREYGKWCVQDVCLGIYYQAAQYPNWEEFAHSKGDSKAY